MLCLSIQAILAGGMCNSSGCCGLACLEFSAVLRLLGVMADFLYGDGRWPAFFSIFVKTKSRSSIRTESKVASTAQSSISPRVSNAANIDSQEENGARPNQSTVELDVESGYALFWKGE